MKWTQIFSFNFQRQLIQTKRSENIRTSSVGVSEGAPEFNFHGNETAMYSTVRSGEKKIICFQINEFFLQQRAKFW